MSTPDPAFVAWFDGEWQKLLETTKVPGMPDASWDRRAAWLVFNGLPTAPDPMTSLLPPAPNLLAGLLPR